MTSRNGNVRGRLKNSNPGICGKGKLNRFGQSAAKGMMQKTEGPKIGVMCTRSFGPRGQRNVIMKGNRVEVPQGMRAGQQGKNQQQKSGGCLQTIVAHGAKVAIMPEKS